MKKYRAKYTVHKGINFTLREGSKSIAFDDIFEEVREDTLDERIENILREVILPNDSCSTSTHFENDIRKVKQLIKSEVRKSLKRVKKGIYHSGDCALSGETLKRELIIGQIIDKELKRIDEETIQGI